MTKGREEKERILEGLRRVDPKLRVTWHKRTEIPRRIKGKLSETMEGEPEEIARTFLSERKELFGVSDADKEFVLRRVDGDRRGVNHVRLIQHYKGIPVFAGELVIHIDKKNVVIGVHGEYQPDIELNVEPSISKETAIENAREHAKSKTGEILVEPELRIFTRKDNPILVWQFIIEGTAVGLRDAVDPAEWLYLIDAHTGAFVHRSDQISTACTASNGSGTGYHSGEHEGTLNTCHDNENAIYLLQDKTREGTEVVTHDVDGSTDKALVSISEDSDNNWDDDVIPPRKDHQGPEVDAHHYTGIVHDYFKLDHERDSFDNDGSNMVVKVHIRHEDKPLDDYNNAFYSHTHKAVFIGDGDDVDFDYLSELDILGHEWTHAIHRAHSGFDNSGESGAVAESMADFFGCMIDGNWLMGEESFKKPGAADALRNVKDPTNGGNYDSTNNDTKYASAGDGHLPDHMDDKYTGIKDRGGIHINCGILNKAAYLIVEGGTHGDIRICPGLGRSKAAEIYYDTLTNNLVYDSDFEDLKDALLTSVEEGSTDAATITNAFAAVGIGDPVAYPFRLYRFIFCWLIQWWGFLWILPPLLFFPIWWPIIFPPGPDPFVIQISAFFGVISLLIVCALTYRMRFQR